MGCSFYASELTLSPVNAFIFERLILHCVTRAYARLDQIKTSKTQNGMHLLGANYSFAPNWGDIRAAPILGLI